MKNEDKLGWVCLVIMFAFYYLDNPASTAGRFFNGMALGFFGRSMYLNYKKRK